MQQAKVFLLLILHTPTPTCGWHIINYQKHLAKAVHTLSPHPPNNVRGRGMGVSKLPLGVSVSVHGCLFLCGPVALSMKDWRPVQGVTTPLAQLQLG